MLVGIYQSAVFLVAILVFYVVDIFLMNRYKTKRATDARNWRTTAKLMIWFIFLLTQPILLPQLGFQTDATWGLWMQFLGLFIVIVAHGLHLWARLHLREFYAERPEIQPHHQLIDTGPYAFVRHPLYMVYMLLAFGLFLFNPALTMLPILIFAASFVLVAGQDEAILLQHLPEYANYMSRTGAFLPRFR